MTTRYRLLAILVIAVAACFGSGARAHHVMPPDALFPQPAAGDRQMKDGKPVTKADVAGVIGTHILPRTTQNRPDDSTLPQIKVWYVLPADGVDERLDTSGAISRSVAVGLVWLRTQTGGRTLRVDTFQGDLDIGFFRMPQTDAQIAATGAYVRDQIEAAMDAAGLTRANRADLVFYGGSSTFSCGGGAYPPALIGSVGALYLKGAVVGWLPCDSVPLAATDTAPPGYWEYSWMHEMLHVLGFVAPCSPNSTSVAHVTDSATDLMYGGADPWRPSVLDLNRDDYFGHGRVGCPDLKQAAYLTSIDEATAAAAPDLNQHGLTGIWYEPATDGQGFGIEVYPDLIAAGTGLVQVSWFTFDSGPAGGADKQRWYTASGPVVSGSATASLAIYRNTGGNFAAAPITTAQQVGTATLSFAACDSAQFSYSLSDGSGRAGVIPLTRITPAVTCATTSARPSSADFAMSGNWFDPATSGQGFHFELNPNSPVFYFAWYTYAPGGQSLGAAGQRWYTGHTPYAAGARSFTMPIYETSGGIFDTPTPAGQTTAVVGTATVVFGSCEAATLSYTFSGGSSAGRAGTIGLTRVGPTGPGCAY